MDLLDDWVCNGFTILVFELLPTSKTVPFMPPFTQQDALTLLDPWPPDVFQTDFTLVEDMHPVGLAFIAAAGPYDSDHLLSIAIFVDGSVQHTDEGDIASYAMVATGMHHKDDSTWESMIGYCGGVVADEEDISWLGTTGANAIEAERCGVILAILWCLQAVDVWNVPIEIHFDCMAAGLSAQGSWNVSIGSLSSEIARSLGQAAQEFFGSRFAMSHIHGHSNAPGNEIADSIAKAIAKLRIPCAANMLDHRTITRNVKTYGSWIWLGFAGLCDRRDAPPIAFGTTRVHTPNRASADFSDIDIDPFGARYVDEGKPLMLNVCTLNVKSLFEDCGREQNKSRFLGKATYLSEQFSWYGYHVIGLQETYTKTAGVQTIGNYTRIVGGCGDNGLLGCELWISKELAGTTVTPLSLVCLHSDPRRLIVRFQHSGIDLCFAVLHAPHSGYSDSDLATWWQETIHHCCVYGKQNLYVLIDSNAQLPLGYADIVGDITDGKCGPNTEWLLYFCDVAHLWIPSTHSHLHRGDIGTWKHPSGCWIRIDYILAPQHMANSVISSWVDQTVDLNQSVEDHRPVGCQLSVLCCKKVHGRPGYNLSRLQDPSTQGKINEFLINLPEIPWDMDVHHHAQIIRDRVHEALSTFAPQEGRSRRSTYITEATWGIRQLKQRIKRQLSRRETQQCSTWKYWVLHCWFEGLPLRTAYRNNLLWLFRREFGMAKNRMLLAQLTQQLRQQLRQDRTEHLVQLSTECESKPLHEVYGQLKRVGVGTKMSKRQVPPLPMFRDQHGNPSTTTEEVAECWRKHCETMEAGTPVSQEYLLAWIMSSHHHRTQFNGDPQLLPTISMLERHLRKMRPGKAPGTDCVPPDMCHYFAGPIARMLFPLVLKQAFGVQEPVDHKGGQLIYAYKGRGAKDNPAAYRGLMLTSVLGKAVRATFRDSFLPSFRKFLSPTYFSAREAGHVGQACMSLQMFCRVARNLNQSAGVLFLDIRAAYYCLCRELTCGWSGTDQQVAHILAHFDLPVEAMNQLQTFLASEGGAVEQSEMHPHHRAILSELTSGTWFRVSGSQATTQTHGGSRPGDGLADLVFAFVFGKLISNLKDDLHSIGIWDDSGWTLECPRDELLKCPDISRETPCNLDVIWADDLALAFRRPLATDVTRVVTTAAEFLFGWCAKYGMRPNTDRGKSEILFQFRGPGSRAERKRLYEAEQPCLLLEPKSLPPVQLHLVAVYKHLGAQLHFGVKLLQEIKIRGGMMRSAYNKLSKKVFKNPNLTLHQRGQLLESMVFSILRWNLGAWYELDNASYGKYKTSILALARRTCMTPHGAERVWQWNDDCILALLNISDPQESLHLARMSFFTTAFHTAPDEFWRLVLAEQSWLRCVHEASFWAFQQLQGSTTFTALHEFQHEWVQGIRDRGPKWKGWIRRAKLHAVLQRHNSSLAQSWHISFL